MLEVLSGPGKTACDSAEAEDVPADTAGVVVDDCNLVCELPSEVDLVPWFIEESFLNLSAIPFPSSMAFLAFANASRDELALLSPAVDDVLPS